jgi:signal transduction histidine kinase
MAVSYVAATLVAVALVEAVILGFVLPRLLNGPALATKLQAQARGDVKLLTLPAARLPAGSDPAAIWKVILLQVNPAAGAAWLPGSRIIDPVLSVDTVNMTRPTVPVEVLLDTGDVIRASSAPYAYRRGDRLAFLNGSQVAAGGSLRTAAGNVAWAVQPLAVGGQRIGAVYIQAPSSAAVSSQVSGRFLLAGGGLLAALFVPVGAVFGLFSTRGLIRRLRRLADSTAVVAEGDFQRRVEVSGRDEIGQLEGAFNAMAARLDEAMATERSSAGASARQAERARIARELHDSISQDLFSLTLLAAGMRKGLPASDRLIREAETMERTAARTVRDMRALLLELRPAVLEDSGIVQALTEVCAAYTERLGVRVQTDIAEVRLGPQAEHVVLRVTQEALGNAVKHAGAGVISVRLAEAGGQVTVEIRDDGRGFDPAAAAERHGMGLAFMRDRVEELGGTFRLDSARGAGTVVVASVPAAATLDVSP